MTFIQNINPENKEEEKKKFFFDSKYNPQFKYAHTPTSQELLQYTPISDEYLPTALKILDLSIKRTADPMKKDEMVSDHFLTKEEVEQIVRGFLEKEMLQKIVTLQFSTQAVARTSIFSNVLTIRLPIEFTYTGLLGMLYHEIGSHQFRSMNDRNQVWYGKPKAFKMIPHFSTEEGLAVLHSTIPKKDKLLRRQALNYYCVEFASKHSFSELFSELYKYIPDEESRWNLCLRVKRGLKDTSLPGAFSKDQTYLKGAIEVWKWLKLHDFDSTKLYIGKVAIEDVERLEKISTLDSLLTPSFLRVDKENYKKALLETGKANFFDR